jgi:hypothetical protein
MVSSDINEILLWGIVPKMREGLGPQRVLRLCVHWSGA